MTEQELISESEEHQINVPTHSFAVVLLAELAPPAIISDKGQFNSLYCTSNMAHFDFVCDFYCSAEMKTKSMIDS